MRFLLVAATLMCAGLLAAQNSPASSSGDWDKMVDRFLSENYFHFHPTQGTVAGLHQYDTKLEDSSRSGIDSETASLKQFRGQIEQFPAAQLNAEQKGDREVLLGYINGTLLELEDIRPWEKDPDNYSSGITASIYTIMSRNYAPQAERLNAVIAREQQAPAVFAAARANLKNPPKVFTDVALLQLPDNVSFFQNDVPSAFSEVKDPRLLAEFKAANGRVISELQSYQKFVKQTITPESHGDFRIGTDNFRKKLLYDEMVDIPLDHLLEIGMSDLRKNQQWYKETAAMLDPSKTPQQIFTEVAHDHPKPEQLLQDFRNVLGGLRAYIEQHHIITLPSPMMPIVQETPPFARALTFASMDTPGPFETKATEGFFNVTLPEPNWSAQQVEEHMEGFNYGTIISTAVHEAFPGHYVQFLWTPLAPSKIRQLINANTDVEGWAHYTEQMMLDEGYGRDPNLPLAQDKKFLKLRLGQLQDALLRDSRFVVGLKMHTGQMTFDQGVDFFVHEGYQSRANGTVETRRGTSDPTYLYYTLGKLEIMKLREDYKKKMGAQYTLQKFNDAFMGQGFPPIKIIREALLGDGSPTL